MANAVLIATAVVYLNPKKIAVPIVIDTEGVKMTKNKLGPKDFFTKSAGQQNQIEGSGHLVFTCLQYSPKSISFPVKFLGVHNSVTLTVEHPDKFNELPNAHFSNLRVIFNHTENETLRLKGASLLLTLFSTPLELQGKLTQKGFSFQLGQSPQGVELAHIGTAILAKVDVAARAARWQDLELFYNFSDPQKNTISDNATAAPRMHLRYTNAKVLTGGGLELSKNSEAASQPFFSRVVRNIQATKAFTIEMWLTPTISGRDKSGTLLAIGSKEDSAGNNYLEIQQNRAGELVIDGTYTTAVGPLGGPLLVPRNMAHLVFTHDATGLEKLYLNGKLEATRSVANSLQGGEDSMLVTLGNTPQGSSSWAGQFYGLAVHSHALTAAALVDVSEPSIQLEGEFMIANAPEPLNGALPATFELLQEKPEVKIAIDNQQFAVRPELLLENIDLRWRGFGNERWELTGELIASLWENKIPMSVGISGASTGKQTTANTNPRLELQQKEQPVIVALDGLGTLEFTTLKLKVPKTKDLKWELKSTSDQAFVVLPEIRFRAFDLFADMLLEGPALGLTTEHLVLNGKWLREQVALYASRTTGDFRMLAATSFPMVFDLLIPKIHDPQTGEVLNEGAQLDEQQLNVELDLELSQNGLLTKVNSNFQWVDQAAVTQETVVPTFTLFTPPPNKNAILGHINATIQSRINELFSETGKQVAEYYLSTAGEQAVIYLSSSDQAPEILETTTPAILTAHGDVGSADSVFWLNQTADTCKLTINLQGKDSEAIDEAYEAFIGDLAPRSASVAGTQLIQRRIAERIPLSFDRLLYYYYGWDKTKGYIDLRSGMRLRIDFQNYQFVQASDQSAERGFTGSGSTYVEVVTYTRQLADDSYEQYLGFGPFQAQLATEGAVDIATNGVGGVFELLKAENRKPVYRLFMPLNPSTGLGPERVATIIGTDTIEEMILVTEEFNADENLPPETGMSFFFRGKATITPEIQVFVRDQAIRVPVGTTVRQLMQRFDDVPQAGIGSQDPSDFLKMGKPLRLVHEGVNSTPSYRFVNIKNTTVGQQMDALDLPLVKGDRFYF